MESRLHQLLEDFSWDRMDRVFADDIAGTAADLGEVRKP